ncbi:MULTISPECIES: hypothetical protein [Paraburkholderia]|nr:MULTISPECIES: hypothetical protein [Paraburkholderia]MDH6146367.1 hypothetical protein [Paraburkholderia sp. WSM4179]
MTEVRRKTADTQVRRVPVADWHTRQVGMQSPGDSARRADAGV